MLRDELGLPERAPRRTSSSTQVRLRRAVAAGDASGRLRRAGGRARARRPRGARAATPRAAATRIWCGCARATPRARPDAVRLARRRTTRWRAAGGLRATQGVAVVPFGGGTSVVGGVEPLRGAFEPVVALDLRRMDRLTDVDRVSLIAHVRARPARPARRDAARRTRAHARPLPAVVRVRDDRRLRRHALGRPGLDRLRAHRRAGARPALRRAGRRDRGEAVAGHGSRPGAARAAGGLRGHARRDHARPRSSVRPLPAERRYEGWSFRSFEEGAEAFRAAGAGARVARRRAALGRGGDARSRWRWPRAARPPSGRQGATCARAATRAAASRSSASRARRTTSRRGERAAGLLRAAGGLALGARPGRGVAARPLPRARTCATSLLDRGVMVETLETATTWTTPARALRRPSARRAARRAGGPRHARRSSAATSRTSTRTGASLYFTFARAPARRAPSWSSGARPRRPPCDAIVAHGGTITHHHAVGRDHAPWMTAEVGELGIELLRAAKQRLDPEGIMNPGKLLPPA